MYDSSLAPWMNCCMRVKCAVNQSLCAGSVRSGTHTPPTSGTHPAPVYACVFLTLECDYCFVLGNEVGEMQSTQELLAPLKSGQNDRIK